MRPTSDWLIREQCWVISGASRNDFAVLLFKVNLTKLGREEMQGGGLSILCAPFLETLGCIEVLQQFRVSCSCPADKQIISFYHQLFCFSYSSLWYASFYIPLFPFLMHFLLILFSLFSPRTSFPHFISYPILSSLFFPFYSFPLLSLTFLIHLLTSIISPFLPYILFRYSFPHLSFSPHFILSSLFYYRSLIRRLSFIFLSSSSLFFPPFI